MMKQARGQPPPRHGDVNGAVEGWLTTAWWRCNNVARQNWRIYINTGGYGLFYFARNAYNWKTGIGKIKTQTIEQINKLENQCGMLGLGLVNLAEVQTGAYRDTFIGCIAFVWFIIERFVSECLQKMGEKMPVGIELIWGQLAAILPDHQYDEAGSAIRVKGAFGSWYSVAEPPRCT